MSNPLKNFYSCVGEGDLGGALDHVHENSIFEVQGPSSVPVYGIYEGRDGVRRLLTTLQELFDTEAFEFKKLTVADNTIFAHGYMRHRVKKTDRVFQCEWALVCEVKDGLITSCKMFEDTAALQTAYA